MKTYIQPATQVSQMKLHTVICISVNEGGTKTTEEVWEEATSPSRILYI